MCSISLWYCYFDNFDCSSHVYVKVKKEKFMAFLIPLYTFFLGISTAYLIVLLSSSTKTFLCAKKFIVSREFDQNYKLGQVWLKGKMNLVLIWCQAGVVT